MPVPNTVPTIFKKPYCRQITSRAPEMMTEDANFALGF